MNRVATVVGGGLGGLLVGLFTIAVLLCVSNFFVMLWLGGLGHVFHHPELCVGFIESLVVTIGLGAFFGGARS